MIHRDQRNFRLNKLHILINQFFFLWFQIVIITFVIKGNMVRNLSKNPLFEAIKF